MQPSTVIQRIDSVISYIEYSLDSNNARFPQLQYCKLPLTPKLPIAKVRLPWLDSPIDMKILCFYYPSPYIFGCQYCNLFYCPVKLNTRYILPTTDKSMVTLFNHEQNNIGKEEMIVEFTSNEHAYQAAKAEYKTDALFVQSLSSGDSCKAGQSRLKMNNKLANKYKQLGGNPYKVNDNHWEFGKNQKRYKIRQNWRKHKIEVMNYAIRQKFIQNYQLIKEYVDSKIPIYFVEHSSNDDLWAD
eukprot:151484_1